MFKYLIIYLIWWKRNFERRFIVALSSRAVNSNSVCSSSSSRKDISGWSLGGRDHTVARWVSALHAGRRCSTGHVHLSFRRTSYCCQLVAGVWRHKLTTDHRCNAAVTGLMLLLLHQVDCSCRHGRLHLLLLLSEGSFIHLLLLLQHLLHHQHLLCTGCVMRVRRWDVVWSRYLLVLVVNCCTECHWLLTHSVVLLLLLLC